MKIDAVTRFFDSQRLTDLQYGVALVGGLGLALLVWLRQRRRRK